MVLQISLPHHFLDWNDSKEETQVYGEIENAFAAAVLRKTTLLRFLCFNISQKLMFSIYELLGSLLKRFPRSTALDIMLPA